MKKVFLIIVGILILIQFIRFEQNDSTEYLDDFVTTVNVPEDVLKILKKSCMDCHSNYTKYPWYNKIAPVSWYLSSHVNEGKEYLNFSKWSSYNKNQKGHILKGLEEELLSKRMPTLSYLLVHEEAKMTDEEYQAVLKWTKSLKVE